MSGSVSLTLKLGDRIAVSTLAGISVDPLCSYLSSYLTNSPGALIKGPDQFSVKRASFIFVPADAEVSSSERKFGRR